MFINEQQGTQMWAKMLKENFNVTDSNKLNWVSQYAAIHEIHESALGVNGTVGQPATAPNMPTGGANAVGVNPIYATPLNTLGMGNPYAPQQLPTGAGATQPGNFFTQGVGSGDIPVSTLPMALNVALLTIGLELVPVIPAKGPWAMLTYMDFPYAGGKMGRKNEVAGIDGVGEGRENKPLYVKLLSTPTEDAADAFASLRTAAKAGDLTEDTTLTVTSTNGAVFTCKFKTFGRMDGGLIVEVVSCVNNGTNVAIADLFADGATATVEGAGSSDDEVVVTRVDFAQTMVDFVDGFANFATGAKESMTRAQNETGTGNVIGLRLFSKWIQMGSYEVTGTVTRQQLQDLPLYGVDAVSKIMEALQNEITQSINARILEHVFALGVTNAVQQRNFQGVDFNLFIGGAGHTLSETTIAHYKDIYGVDHKASWGDVEGVEVSSTFENLHTRQRRISTRILAAANLIQTVGRHGRATWVVTNAKVATALQDVSSYVVAPMANGMVQDGSKNLFLAGSLAGLQVYVDPYMAWDDTRVCVGRKGDGNSPGVIFMPYILADTVSITAEGTMAPKMLVNSRFAIADAGFYPETQYYTFAIGAEAGYDII